MNSCFCEKNGFCTAAVVFRNSKSLLLDKQSSGEKHLLAPKDVGVEARSSHFMQRTLPHKAMPKSLFTLPEFTI